jgi:hypothetical protein
MVIKEDRTMRVADEKKEKLFVEYFTSGETLANATKSAQKAGYNKNPSQMGYVLKKKYEKEIRKINEEKITGVSGKAINVLEDLLHSDQDSVRLNCAKLILELGNYSSQNININMEDNKHKTDAELLKELEGLVAKIPTLAPKLSGIQHATEEESTDTSDNSPIEDEKRVTH